MKIEQLKNPPSNIMAERAIIGILLTYDDSIFYDLRLKSEHFFDDRLSKIYGIISSIKSKGNTIDINMIISHTDNENIKETVYDIASDIYSQSNVKTYEEDIYSCYVRRNIIRGMGNVIADCYENSDLSSILSKLSKASDFGALTQNSKFSECAIDIAMKIGENRNFISTYGFTDLDKILGGYIEGQLIIVGARPGVGKAQPLYSKIMTPNGWTTMGDVKIGDIIIGQDGSEKLVHAIPYEGIQKVYRIYLDDGTYCDAGEHHEFRVNEIKRKKFNMDIEVCDLIKIMETNRKISIENIKPIQYKKTILPICPYTLGVLIGDGCLGGDVICLSLGDSEILNYINLPEGDKISHKSKYDYSITMVNRGNGGTNTKKIIESLGLNCKSYNKYIPEQYLLSSIEDRIMLLQGLMDTDGTVIKRREGKSTGLSYTTSSIRLCNDICSLVKSLGGSINVSHRIPKYIYKGERKEGHISYTVAIGLPNYIKPFKLERKLKIHKPNANLYSHIRNIEYIGDMETKCISVKDGMYITDNYIATHNTLVGCNLIDSIVKRGVHGCFFTLEMTATEISKRIIAKRSGVSMRAIDSDESCISKVHEETGKVLETGYDFDIIDGLFDYHSICIEIKRQAIKNGVKVVYIDYLGLIDYADGSRTDNTVYAVSQITKGMKRLAKEMGITIVMLCQLNRDGANGKPNKAQLRSSGSIEQDADVIMLLYQNYDDEQHKKYIEVIVDKNRNGIESSVYLGVDKRTMSIYDVDQDECVHF